jgi:hypothetical protein
MRIDFLEWRNTLLGVLFIGLCAYFGYIAGAEHIGGLGPTLTGAGLGVAGVVAARGYNKWAENRKTQGDK